MSEDLISRVTGVIARTQHLPPESVTIDSTFEELKIDSLDGINAARKIRSVREMVEGIEKLLAAKQAASPAAPASAAPPSGNV